MPRSHRIKPKAGKKKQTKLSKIKHLPWGLIAVILCSVLVLAMLYQGAQREGSSFGSGLKALLNTVEENETDTEISTLIETKRIEIKST